MKYTLSDEKTKNVVQLMFLYKGKFMFKELDVRRIAIKLLFFRASIKG